MSMHNPSHPGEILKELVIEPTDVTITDISEHLNISRKTLLKEQDAARWGQQEYLLISSWSIDTSNTIQRIPETLSYFI